MTGRPIPVPDGGSAPFWDAAATGALVLARCPACRAYVHPPAPVCPACGQADAALGFEPVGGAGVVRSWTVVRQAFLPGFDQLVPFVLVDVQLDDAPEVRLIGRLVDRPSALPLPEGTAVVLAFEELGDGDGDTGSVPAFRRRTGP